nr:MAG TPA: hypothetical protein [Caudoviricetes sp.]DAY38181.1 MAG TPA: hypothetical protein [Caudoviricetes sp.]
MKQGGNWDTKNNNWTIFFRSYLNYFTVYKI